MSIYDLPYEEKKAYFRENKRLSRLKEKGVLTTEEVKAKNREQYLKNKQRYKDKAAVWNKKHGEYMRALSVQNRLKKYYPAILEASAITIEEMEQWFVDNRDKGCSYCGSTERYAMDHIMPLCSGGAHAWNNIQLLCSKCNSWKGAGTEGELQDRVRQMYTKMCV